MESSPDWKDIRNQTDINEFMKSFGGFHDSCLKELHLSTTNFVDEKFSMHRILNFSCQVRILFQRQQPNPSAIELLFEELVDLKITPPPANYDSMIFKATFILKEAIFYWAGVEEWSPDDEDKNEVSWIGAQKVKWRDVSSWMGQELRYGTKG